MIFRAEHRSRAILMHIYRAALLIMLLTATPAAMAQVQSCSDCANACLAQNNQCLVNACVAGGGTPGPMNICSAPAAPTGVTPDYQKQQQMCGLYQSACNSRCKAPTCK